MGSAVRMGRRKERPGLRRRPRGWENLLTGGVGRLCRGALSSGAFSEYLSGPGCRCDGRRRDCGGPCGRRGAIRDLMRIEQIAELR